MRTWKILGLILIIIGGLNWGLVGFFEYNLVDAIFGAGSIASRTIYAIVGVASLLMIIGMMMKPMMMDEKTMKMNKKY